MMYSVVKWVAYSLLVVAILPYSIEKPWGFRIAVVAALISIICARLQGWIDCKDYLESLRDPKP